MRHTAREKEKEDRRLTREAVKKAKEDLAKQKQTRKALKGQKRPHTAIDDPEEAAQPKRRYDRLGRNILLPKRYQN